MASRRTNHTGMVKFAETGIEVLCKGGTGQHSCAEHNGGFHV